MPGEKELVGDTTTKSFPDKKKEEKEKRKKWIIALVLFCTLPLSSVTTRIYTSYKKVSAK